MDLQKLISELTAVGITQREIADAMECTQATVSRYASGEIGTTNYASGKALVELHLLHVQKPSRRPAPRARRAA
jgi:predicted transcriptional regulator